MKSGFVNIVGNPNVGKSTLMNALVGERISIITSKAQTTRHRIMGIVNGDDFQIVYSDTPGVLKPNYKMQEAMLGFSISALTDADVLLYVTDSQDSMEKNAFYLDKVKKMTANAGQVHTIVVINKIDLIDQKKLESLVEEWHEELPEAEIIPLSAITKFGVDMLIKHIVELLPEGEPYFDRDALTDKSERFFVGEIIREKILLYYKKEIPYSVEIEIEEFHDEPEQTHIRAVIHVTRDSQKGIIIGAKGSMLKKIGALARGDIEGLLQTKVFLELWVKVRQDWRNSRKALEEYGYHN